jgi:hypothetical protein
MSKALGDISKVAGAIASVAAFIPGVGQAVAAVAGVVSTISGIGAALTAKPPQQNVVGSVTQTILSPDAPAPVLLGRTYSGGVIRYDRGYGGKVDGVDNPYRFIAAVYSVAGPVQSFESVSLGFEQVVGAGTGLDAATGYYNNFLWVDRQLGARPEADSLAPQFSGAPDWGADYKLSGKAAAGWTFRFDKTGVRFASGIDRMGGILEGVKSYDPRLDSTYPGGSGACRHLPAGDVGYDTARATQVYSNNLGILGLQYALGWFKNGIKEAGVGLPIDAIDVASFVAFANTCDANGWTGSGIIYEPAESNWQNLRRILATGGAAPVFAGGILSVYYQSSRVSLDTITDNDLAGEVSFTPWPAWQDGRNGIIPKYRSEDHQWELVQSDLIQDSTLLANDGGEPKTEEITFELCDNADQAAQLASYLLWERRERGPFEVPVKARLRDYRPGDKLTLSIEDSTRIPEMDCVVIRRSFDPAAMRWILTLREEIDAKHAGALGVTGTAPETTTLTTNAERDTASSSGFTSTLSAAVTQSLITSFTGTFSSAVDGTNATVTVPDTIRTYPAPFESVSVDGGEVTGLDFNTAYLIYYDDESLSGGAVTYGAAETLASASVSADNPYRHFVGSIVTVDSLGNPGTTPPEPPPGTNGGGIEP